MSNPEPPPGTPGPTEQDASGVSPVVWIGLAALLVAGGIYAYSVFVPPEMPKDGMAEPTAEGDGFDDDESGTPAVPAAPAGSTAADSDAEAEGNAEPEPVATGE